ncbi:MAG: sulfatase-like hydrolase/transferase [Verrucomicrobia bacterium]|nr:sulfatase-like hydrolase/transferase [Verrucomicrobiota bacterium]
MTRVKLLRYFLFSFGLVCLPSLVTPNAATAASRTDANPIIGQHQGLSKQKPNVLLVCVDDLKPLLGCYGDKQIVSPSIDRLASRGLRFERAYCNQAVCAPSRNALMTGVRPTTLGIYDLGTNFRVAATNAVTLSQYFMRHGYRTEALGKIFHVGHGNHEDAASWSVPHWRANSIAYLLPENRAPQGLTREEALFANRTNAANLPRGAAYESADAPDNAYPDGQIAEEAIRRLHAAQANPAQPFFLAVGFLKPHLPFCAPKKYWDLYRRESFHVPALRTPPQGAPKYAPTGWGELRQYRDIPPTGPLDDEKVRALLHGYHAAVSYMDAQLGRVLVELDRLGLTSNTIVVLWGDHGWHLGDHGLWCKHTNYEQATRIPLIISAPGVTRAGTSTRALAETVDLYPTLCELAGLPAPKNPQPLEGQSLVPVLKKPSRASKEAVFHVYPRNRPGDGAILGRAVRTERYRLVEWKKPGAPSESAEFELYDYKKDPLETKNLAGEEPKLVKKLHTPLLAQPEAKPQVAAARTTAARPNTNRAALFARKDANNDGQLTRAEFLAKQPDPTEAPKRFERFDANQDGVLSRDEFIHMGAAPKP